MDVIDKFVVGTLILLFPLVPFYILKGSLRSQEQKIVHWTFFFYSLVVSYFGLVPMIFGWSEYHYYFLNITRLRSIFVLAVMASLALLLYALGVWSFSKLRIAKEIDAKAGIRDLPIESNTLTSLCFLALSICLLMTGHYLSQLEHIPLVEAIVGDGDVSLARSQASNSFQGSISFHYYQFFFQDFVSFIFFVFIGKFLLWQKRKDFWFVVISGVFAVAGSLLTGEKAPVLWLALGASLCLVLGGRRFKTLGAIALVSSVALVIVIGLLSLLMNTQNYTTLNYLGSLGQRISMGALTPAYFHLEMFPSFEDYLFGRSFPNPKGMFDFNQFNLPIVTMEFLSSSTNSNIIKSAPGPYWSEAFVNFGFLGVIIVSFCCGFGLSLFQRASEYLAIGPIQVALLAWLVTHYVKLNETGFSQYLLDQNLVLIVLSAAVMSYFSVAKLARPRYLKVGAS